MPEQGDRFDRDYEFERGESSDELHPEPDSDPYDVEFISPSMVTLDWPSFDLQSSEYGDVATKAYVSYMLGRGPKKFSIKVSTEREGFFAVDYAYKSAKGDQWDTWDYHGPMTLQIEGTFVDDPIDTPRKGLDKALEACFRAGGYDESSEIMRPFEKVLSPLRLSVSNRLKGLDIKSLILPLKSGKVASLKKEDFIKAVFAAKPEVYVHWRGI